MINGNGKELQQETVIIKHYAGESKKKCKKITVLGKANAIPPIAVEIICDRSTTGAHLDKIAIMLGSKPPYNKSESSKYRMFCKNHLDILYSSFVDTQIS